MTVWLSPHVLWLYMASAGPQRPNLDPKQKSFSPAQCTQPCQAWRSAPQQAKPIWALEGQHVSTFQERCPPPSGVPLQQSSSLYPPSPCPTHPAERSQPCPELCGSTLLHWHSCLRAKPGLESYRIPFQSPQDSGSATARAMSSVLMEPCLLPALPEEHKGSGVKGSALGSARQAAGSYRPVLNNNSFLRPVSTQVPSLQSPEIKKLKNAPSFPAVSWPCSRDDGDCPPSTPVAQSSEQEQRCVPSLSLVPGSVTLRRERCSWPLGDTERRARGFGEKEPELSSRKAAQRLAGQTATSCSFGHEVRSPGRTTAGGVPQGNRWGLHIAAQLTPKETIAPLNLEPGSSRARLAGGSSLTGSEGALVCTKRIGPHLLASRAASPERGTDCRPLGGRERAAEPQHPAAISQAAAQMSALMLGKEEKRPQAVLPGKPDIAAGESLLEPSHPQDDVEEELPDGLDESCGTDEEEDSDSDASSVAGMPAHGSGALLSRKCIECLAQPTDDQEKVLKPALVCSLFPNVPPTIYFSTRDERVEKLPWEQRKLLRWKMCTVTPNIVKQTIGRSHFRVSKKSNDWLGCWGHHMKSPGFRAIREHQKPASARGIGIQVIHKWSQLPKRRPLLVQRYLHKPYLIGGRKFDLRIYVYVTCYDPLRVYLFKDGLVRFASCKYSSSMKSLSNKFVHLTNYSVNKKNTEYKSNSDETACQGHKWALKALWSYLTQKGVNSEAIWEKIKDIVIKTIIASEPYVNSLVKMYVRRPYCCHELFGFDIMLDENLKPWILEVNISPSLHSNSPLDVSIKGQMIRDLLNLAGFVLPSTDSVASRPQTRSDSTCSLGSALKEKPRPASEHFTAEKMKKAYYLTQKVPDQDFYSSVLDILTPDDVRVLVETEDEYSRRGQFERVFPTHISMRYLRFFEQPRYFNILVTQWELKYYSNKHKGLELLKNWCVKGYHTGAGTDLAQMWSLPKSFLLQKSGVQSNGFSKLERGGPGKLLPPADEDLRRCLEPSPAPTLPLSKHAAAADQKPAACL
ncbi:tubulin monoglutamylase TTLL4 isoform 2-T3 [Mergus octosetaceus]